ncbi:hypothetical protein TNCV_935691 [Trichonephila clavipes]|nr:hypothetical protein TNCV_935691 [Trichonephila clavipes]
MMLGMAKVGFSILLSGMTAIGRAMESGRRGYGSSSGWKVFEFLAWLRAKRLLSELMTLEKIDISDCIRLYGASDKLFHLRSRGEAIPVMPLREKRKTKERQICWFLIEDDV